MRSPHGEISIADGCPILSEQSAVGWFRGSLREFDLFRPSTAIEVERNISKVNRQES